jgi:hypothetical protein
MTMLELFQGAGLTVDAGMARTFDEPQREQFLPAIRAMATAAGANPDMAVEDALPLQFVLRGIAA